MTKKRDNTYDQKLLKDLSYSVLILFIIFILNASCSVEAQNNEQKNNLKVGLKKGDIAPEIELHTPEGDTIKLSSLRGSLVYIDFWASWCKGCRVVNKHLKRIHHEYKNKKFINGNKFYIYSVSLDTDKNRWLRTIEEDSLQCCIHVSDLKGFNSKITKIYNLKGLPVNYLIDGNGVIIDSYVSLRSALDKILLKEGE